MLPQPVHPKESRHQGPVATNSAGLEQMGQCPSTVNDAAGSTVVATAPSAFRKSQVPDEIAGFVSPPGRSRKAEFALRTVAFGNAAATGGLQPEAGQPITEESSVWSGD